MKLKKIVNRFSAILVFGLLVVLLPSIGLGFVLGDINGDELVGLPESIYSLQVASGLAVPVSGKTISVPADYATIQEAIDAAADGDTIEIQPGTYPEALAINRKALTLRGTDRATVIIDNDGGGYGIKISNSPGVSIETMTIQECKRGIYVTENASVHIAEVTVRNSAEHGIAIISNSSAEITDSTSESNGSAEYPADGIYIVGNSSVFISGTVGTSNNRRHGIWAWMNSCVLMIGVTYASSGNTEDGISVNTNASLFLYQSALSFDANGSRGISVLHSSSMLIDDGTTVTITNAGSQGMVINNSSNLKLSSTAAQALTISGSQDAGIHVGKTSNLTIEGEVLIENCNSTGVDVFESSSVVVSSKLEVINCQNRGINLGRASNFYFHDNSAYVKVSGSGFIGIHIIESSVLRGFGGTLVVENNQGGGIYAKRNATISILDQNNNTTVQVQDNTYGGISISGQSYGRIFPGVTTRVTGNGVGLNADNGSNIVINDATISDNTGACDVNVSFGSLSTLNNNTIGTMCCDSSVLSRGTTVCP